MTRMRELKYWRNLALYLLLSLVLGYVVVVVRLGAQTAQTYARPPRDLRSARFNPAALNIPYEDVALTTRDGLVLQAWYTPPQNGVVILVAHGYASSRSAEDHAFFAKGGFGVLSWDARAHGQSEGERSTLGYTEIWDVEAALTYLHAQADVRAVGAYGLSMGGATVLRAAAAYQEIGAVVVDSVFVTLDEMVTRVVQWAVLRPSVRWFAEREAGEAVAAMRPVDEIGKISPRPVFIIHGGADETVGPEAGARLYAAAREPKEFWVEPGVGHVNMHAMHPEVYRERVLGFFEAHLVIAQP